MMSMQGAVTDLAATFSGHLVQPANADYDSVRQVHNGLIDKRPVLIARCNGIADIIEAVKLRSNGDDDAPRRPQRPDRVAVGRSEGQRRQHRLVSRDVRGLDAVLRAVPIRLCN